MYTWEIENLLRYRNYLIYNDEYFNIMDTNPQITEVKYNGFDESFETWTREDDNSVNYFKYKVRVRENNNKENY